MTLNPLCKLSRWAAMGFTLLGSLIVRWFGEATDEMARILLLTFALTSLAAVWVMIRLATLADAASRPRVEAKPPLLEVVELGPRCPSRHLVDLALVEILEATAKVERRQVERWKP